MYWRYTNILYNSYCTAVWLLSKNAILYNLLDFKYSYYICKSIAVKQSSLYVFITVPKVKKCFFFSYFIKQSLSQGIKVSI